MRSLRYNSRWNSPEDVDTLVRLATMGTQPPYGLLSEMLDDPYIDQIIFESKHMDYPQSLDPITKDINTQCIIGIGRSRKPLKIQIPLVLNPLPINNLNSAIMKVLIKTALNTGCAVVIDDHPINLQTIDKNGKTGKLIFRISTLRTNITPEAIELADAFEIDLTELNFSTPSTRFDTTNKDLLKGMIYTLREVCDYRVPILVRISNTKISKTVETLLKIGADAIVIGEGLELKMLSPANLIKSFVGPTEAITMAKRPFSILNAIDKGQNLLLECSPKNGVDMLKYLCLGAKALYITVPQLVALGCDLCGGCHSNKCNAAIATTDSKLTDKLDIDDAVVKISNLIFAYNHMMRYTMALLGIESVEDLSTECLGARDYTTAAVTGLRLMGLNASLPFWEI